MPHVRPDSIVASALAASDDGWTDAANAHWHGVAVKTIRRWRRVYQRRGLARGQRHTNTPCPRCGGGAGAESAYAELFGWYLGDGHISRGPRGVYSLHIYDDRRYTALNDHVMDLLRRVKPGGRPHTREVPGCLVMTVGWNHWPCLFPQHGPGRKHERRLGMTEWQWEVVERCPANFLRGLFHSDGSRVNNWTRRMVAGEMKRYDYPRWQFTNHSTEIQAWCCQALDLVDVPWRQSSWKTISVSTRAGVAWLDELIGPKS